MPARDDGGRAWYTAGQVAAALGVHRSTVKRIPPEQLPYYRMTQRGGSPRRYLAADLAAYAAGIRVAAQPAPAGAAD